MERKVQSLLYNSQDMMLQIRHMTGLFTTLYHKKLVVGRVQTPTLAMLVERDGKISTFQKEKYFNVHVGKGALTADLEKVKI